MKKANIFICVLLFLSCCTPSNNDKVQTAFKEYVKNNFDDPNSLEQIVSIEMGDTFSTTKIKELWDKTKKQVDSIRSVDSLLSDSFYKASMNSSPQTRVNVQNNSSFKAAIFSAMDNVERMHDFYINNSPDYYMERLKQQKDTTIINMVLKCRVKKKDELIMEEYSISTDTLFRNIRFKKGPFTAKEQGWEGFLDCIEKLTDIYNTEMDMLLERRKQYEKLLRILNNGGKGI